MCENERKVFEYEQSICLFKLFTCSILMLLFRLATFETMLNRFMTNICSDQLAASKEFYCKLFQLTVNFDSDWFIQLMDEKTGLELGLIKRSHEIVPPDDQLSPKGFYLTFVVEDVESIYTIAQQEQFAIVQAPHDTFYGQRRLLLRDPDGALVDVSAPIPNFQFQTETDVK